MCSLDAATAPPTSAGDRALCERRALVVSFASLVGKRLGMAQQQLISRRVEASDPRLSREPDQRLTAELREGAVGAAVVGIAGMSAVLAVVIGGWMWLLAIVVISSAVGWLIANRRQR